MFGRGSWPKAKGVLEGELKFEKPLFNEVVMGGRFRSPWLRHWILVPGQIQCLYLCKWSYRFICLFEFNNLGITNSINVTWKRILGHPGATYLYYDESFCSKIKKCSLGYCGIRLQEKILKFWFKKTKITLKSWCLIALYSQQMRKIEKKHW